jgi:hypothetical protein
LRALLLLIEQEAIIARQQQKRSSIIDQFESIGVIRGQQFVLPSQ